MAQMFTSTRSCAEPLLKFKVTPQGQGPDIIWGVGCGLWVIIWTRNDWLVYLYKLTGSNTHNNGNPAGDGQAGDDGEGKAGECLTNFKPVLNVNNHDIP